MESPTTIDPLDRAEDLLEQGEYEAVLEIVTGLYEETLPSSARGRGLALEVVALERLDRTDDAELLIREVMKEEGDDLAFVLAAGLAFSDYDAFPQAEVFLRNLCELQPENPLAWFNLAISLGREGRYPESVQMYNASLEHDPEFADAHLQKAYCLETMEQFGGAAEAYRGYLALEPTDGATWRALGIVESERQEYAAAYTAFGKALESGHDPADTHFNWAITALQQEDVEQAERNLLALRELEPEGARTLLTQADLEESQGDVWPAWESLGEAFEAVLEEEDEVEVCGSVAAAIIRFAIKHDMRENLDGHVARIFEEQLFSEEVLEVLLALEGRMGNAAMSQQVVLQCAGDVAEAETRYVVYGVSAEDPKQAGEWAIEFEARCGEGAWEVHSVQPISEPDEGLLGVYWRSEESTRPPGPAA